MGRIKDYVIGTTLIVAGITGIFYSGIDRAYNKNLFLKTMTPEVSRIRQIEELDANAQVNNLAKRVGFVFKKPKINPKLNNEYDKLRADPQVMENYEINRDSEGNDLINFLVFGISFAIAGSGVGKLPGSKEKIKKK